LNLANRRRREITNKKTFSKRSESIIQYDIEIQSYWQVKAELILKQFLSS